MSCSRAHQVDLLGFLANPRAPEFAEFRDHYPACPDCSAEVRAWTELHLQLQAPEHAHPPAQLLLRFDEAPGSLDGAQHAAVARHLERCASCRDELRALRRFDFSRAHAAEPAAGSARVSLAEWLARLRRLIWSPAFAYVLVLLLLYPAVISRWDELSEQPLVMESAPLAPEVPQELAKAPGQVGGETAMGAAEQALPESEARTARDEPGAGIQRAGGEVVRGVPEPPRPAALPPQAGPDAQAIAQSVEEARLEAEGADRSREEFEPARREAEIAYHSLSRARPPSRESAQAPRARRIMLPDDMEALAELDAGRLGASRSELTATRIGDVVGVEVPVVFSVPAGAEVEVRVAHPDDRRELRERVAVAVDQPAVRVDLPAAWATPGRYRVELRVVGDPPSAQRVFEFGLTLR